MKIKNIVQLVMLIIIMMFLISCNSSSNITIRNLTNKTVDNLSFYSNLNSQVYEIDTINPGTEASFKYRIGGINENAINLKYRSENGEKIYSIIEYVDRTYSKIYINIISVSNDGGLEIEVELYER